MTMEKHPFEDVFPIKHADLPLPSLFFWGVSISRATGLLAGFRETLPCWNPRTRACVTSLILETVML